MKVAYVGFGQLANQIRHHLNRVFGTLEEIGFDDEAINASIKIMPFTEYESDSFKEYNFYVCLGYNHLREKNEIFQKLIWLDRKLPSFVHPSSIIDPSVSIGAGVIIYPGCIIDIAAKIEYGSLLNNGVIVSHNTNIGKCNYISPGVIISGNVGIGAQNFIGTGSCIRDGVTIGNDCKIGMGSSIVKSMPDRTEGYGVPFSSKKIDSV